VIFAAAAAVAVVQATNSDTPPNPPTEEAAALAVGQSGQAQQAAQPIAQSADSDAEQPLQPEQQEQTPAQPMDAPDSAEPSDADEPQQSEAVAPVSSSQPPATPEDEQQDPLQGFIVPIAGAHVTEYEGHLPNATRTYRNDGIHEGFDFYEWAARVTIDYNTEILAAKSGVVIRADLDYVDITPADWARFESFWEDGFESDQQAEDVLDELRGRQVWLDHGRGVVTRYAHLSAIAEGIAVGVEVQQGQVIGYPGESGQEEVYHAPGTDIHLHFEIRIGDGWLGQGETPLAARALYLNAFGITED